MSREDRIDFIDFIYQKYLERKKYFENTMTYLKMIKEICRSVDPECKIILFGSYARGTTRPDSDIDVLIISKIARNAWERARLYKKISERIGFEHPFELHIVTPEEYEGWYKKFINAHIEI